MAHGEFLDAVSPLYTDSYYQLRATFKVVQKVKNNSGWRWSNEHGAGITAATMSVWNDYVAKNPAAEPFKTKGWRHWDKMVEIMPAEAPPIGAHVFRPGNTSSAKDVIDSQPGQHDPQREGSPPWPTELPERHLESENEESQETPIQTQLLNSQEVYFLFKR